MSINTVFLASKLNKQISGIKRKRPIDEEQILVSSSDEEIK